MILRLTAIAAAVTFLGACTTTNTTQATAPAAPAAAAAAAPAPTAQSAGATSSRSAAQAQAAANDGRRCDNVTGTRVKTACSNAPVQTGNQDTARQLQDRPNPSIPPGG